MLSCSSCFPLDPVPARSLACGRFSLSLARPLIMGVLNVTPDSFSDGGEHASTGAAVAHARRMVEEGADIIDVGGESTRPGAAPVPLDEERRRVLPVIEALHDLPVPMSVDTCNPQLMREAIAAGAAMVNDVLALRAAGALEAVAGSRAGVCLMHMQGEPRTMQHDPRYDDVVAEVCAFLRERIEAAVRGGIGRERIVADPGFGFGKTARHNLELLRRFDALHSLGVPQLAGLSRKSLLGRIAGRDVAERGAASVAAAVLAVLNGADIVRVHDVAPTRDALAVVAAINDPDYSLDG